MTEIHLLPSLFHNSRFVEIVQLTNVSGIIHLCHTKSFQHVHSGNLTNIRTARTLDKLRRIFRQQDKTSGGLAEIEIRDHFAVYHVVDSQIESEATTLNLHPQDKIQAFVLPSYRIGAIFPEAAWHGFQIHDKFTNRLCAA